MRSVCAGKLHEAVSYITTLFTSLCYFLITRLMFSNIMFKFVFLFCTFLSILCILCFVFFVHYFSFSVYSCPFPICANVYRPQPSGGVQVCISLIQTCTTNDRSSIHSDIYQISY